MKLRRSFAAAILAALFSTAVLAAGNWSTLPIIARAAFCNSTVTGAGAPFSGNTGQGQGTTGSICGSTTPAGPPNFTGNELIPMDTGLAGGASPQTATAPSSLVLGGGGFTVFATGTSGTVPDGISEVILALGAGTTFAATMPANPWVNQRVCFSSVGSADMTAFSTIANTGQSLVQGAAPTTLPVQTVNTAATKTMRICYLYRSSNTSWYRIQ